MRRLSALDALFLYMETPETPMHVASVTIFKPADRHDDLFERFRAHTEARLDLLPSYRRRLEWTPLGLDHPVWIDDEAPDLDYHIRRAHLPKPGGMAELRALVAQLHATPLDRKRPLWEYTFIEGLEDGGFAVYVKVHHCAMDGIAGMATLGVMYDFAPHAEAAPPKRIVPPDAEPADTIEIATTAIGDFVRQGWRAVKALPSVARTLTRTAPHFLRDAKFLYRYVKEMPRTPFNAAISGRRVYATSSLKLAEVKRLAKARGVTVNDVVLALTAGALRRYLADKGALPETALTAGVPASLRPIGDAQLNNQVIFTVSRLPTDVEAPLQRLAAAQAASQEAKDLFADLREFVTTNVSIVGAPLVIIGLARLWAGAKAANWIWPFFNLVVSNVPGPREPMYCLGAKATHYFPVSIPFHGGALNLTVQSYLDTLDFGLIACADTVPDAQRIADLIVEDFAELKAAEAEFEASEAVGRIALTVEAKSPAPHKALALSEAKPPRAPRPAKAAPSSALTREIDALGEATAALARRLAAKDRRRESPETETPEPAAKPKPAKARASGKRAPRPAPETPPEAAAEGAPPPAPEGGAEAAPAET